MKKKEKKEHSKKETAKMEEQNHWNKRQNILTNSKVPVFLKTFV